MDTKGIMQEIREHLARGKSSAEVIALGHKPPTVYKVQRQMRKKPPGHTQALVRVADTSHPVLAGPEDSEWWPSVDDLFEEDEPLALHNLLDRGFPELSKRVEALSKSLDQALSERKASELKVRDLESKVAALGELTRGITNRLEEQATRGDRLEQRAEAAERKLGALSELVGRCW